MTVHALTQAHPQPLGTATAAARPLSGARSIHPHQVTAPPARPPQRSGIVRRSDTPAHSREDAELHQEEKVASNQELAEMYRQHADFVWRCLQRFGVNAADQPDLLQEVFVVVHRKLPGFERRSSETTWLYGIALRVASRHRRRLQTRREQPLEDAPASVSLQTPERALANREDAEQLTRILDTLPLTKRAVFVMFELEGLTCHEIADTVGVAVGTVYSRLHHARKLFAKAHERQQRRDCEQQGGAKQ